MRTFTFRVPGASHGPPGGGRGASEPVDFALRAARARLREGPGRPRFRPALGAGPSCRATGKRPGADSCLRRGPALVTEARGASGLRDGKRRRVGARPCSFQSLGLKR